MNAAVGSHRYWSPYRIRSDKRALKAFRVAAASQGILTVPTCLFLLHVGLQLGVTHIFIYYAAGIAGLGATHLKRDI